MKKIEDIEKMELEELESAALSVETEVPSGLEDRIKAAVAAKILMEEAKPKPTAFRRWAPYAALAVAAGLTAVAIIPRVNKPRDTFDDPYLAYAQVEATFKTISNKMSVGIDLASKAEEAADKPVQIIKKINEK